MSCIHDDLDEAASSHKATLGELAREFIALEDQYSDVTHICNVFSRMHLMHLIVWDRKAFRLRRRP